MTTLQKLLGNIDDPRPTTKEASERPRRQSSSRSTDDAIAKAMNELTTTKVASEGDDQTAGLMKLAQDIQKADAAGEKAASYQNGREMGRGFIDELAQYTKAAHDVSQSGVNIQKLATDNSEQGLIEKFAAEEPGTFENLVQRGYNDQMALLQKNAQEKTAADQALLEKFASEDPATFEAVVKRGFDEASGHLMKIAQDEFNAGYRETIAEHTKVAAVHYAMGFDAMAAVIRSSQANSRQQAAR